MAGPEYVELAGGLNNEQYGELCEIMGTANHMEVPRPRSGHIRELNGLGVQFASNCMNCASPDTGNMETLCRFANSEQKEAVCTSHI